MSRIMAATVGFVLGLLIGSASCHAETGLASIYNCCARTASGEHFSTGGLTAAHKSLPFGSLVRVTNESNGRSVDVRINDRGPFVRGRIIDLTPAAARAIGDSGLAHVRVDIISYGSGAPRMAHYRRHHRRHHGRA